MPARVAHPRPLAVAILSGGESRRMGSPKALLPYRGKTFLEHLVEVTRHPRVGATCVVLGPHIEPIRQLLLGSAARVVVNAEWQQGQLSSIQTAIRSLLADRTEGLILCPVDHPLISKTLIGSLIEAFDASGKAIALPTFRGRRGHPVIFRSTLYDELLTASPGGSPADRLGPRRRYRRAFDGRGRGRTEPQRSGNPGKGGARDCVGLALRKSWGAALGRRQRKVGRRET